MLLLLRRRPNPNLLRRHFSAFCDDAKLVSTVFLLYPHRLTSLLNVITPYVALLSIRRFSDNPKSALDLLRFLSSDLHVSLSAATYRYVISLLVRSHLFVDALNLFDKMTERREECWIDETSFVVESLLTDFVRNGDLSCSLRLIDRASALGCQRIQSYAFNGLLNLLISRNRAQDAVFLFRQHSRSQVFTLDTCNFNNIIGACCRLGDVDGAFSYFEEMKDFGCVPDTITHNVLIDGLCKANQVDRGLEILRGIRGGDGACSPNVKTYTSVVSGYCKLGKMEEAENVFDEMVEIGIKPSRVTYNVLIDGYGKAGNLISAVSVYERMRVCGCSPDVVTFTSLIHGHCRSGQIDDAMRILHEMSEMQVRPNIYTFSVVVDSLCKKNRLREARDLLIELNGCKDIVARAFVYNPVIDGFCKAGDVEEANSILVEMEMRGCRPDKYTYTILIIGHFMKGRSSEAIGLFNKMVATGCAPDSITVNSFVSLLFKAGMPGEAMRIIAMPSRKDMGINVLSSLKEVPSLLTKNADVTVAL